MLKGNVHATGVPTEVRSPRDAVKILGPGLITGASDADPSGIGTYSQAGSQSGFGLLWTAVFTYPLMAAVQEMCGRIALQTGQGLGTVLRRRHPTWLVGILIAALGLANIFNVGADLGAIGAAIQMLTGGHVKELWVVAPVGVAILTAQMLLTYDRIASVLKWLTVVLFAYVITAFLSHPPLVKVLMATVVPHVEWNKDYLTNLVAIFGTTITPYLFFWQASAEVDAQRQEGETSERDRVGISTKRLRVARYDIFVGTFFAQIVMYAILLTSGSVLHGTKNGGSIQSADQAAAALTPFAGHFATVIFAVGIIGTGLLAVPVMSASATYAVREFFGFGGSLGMRPRYRPTFYLVLVGATIVGVLINYLGLNPIRALILAAGVNGVVAPALLVCIVIVAADRKIMRKRVSGKLSLTLTIIATAVMTVGAVALIVTMLTG